MGEALASERVSESDGIYLFLQALLLAFLHFSCFQIKHMLLFVAKKETTWLQNLLLKKDYREVRKMAQQVKLLAASLMA